jgi:hypothetical protein
VLDPSEVVDGECHLAVYSPHDTRVHCDPEDLKVDNLPISSEGLVNHRLGCEEEDNYGAYNSIKHPTKYTGPAEEEVLYALEI